MDLNNFQIKSARNASSLSRFGGRYARDKFLHDYAEKFLFLHNGNTSLLVEKLLGGEFERIQASDPEFTR